MQGEMKASVRRACRRVWAAFLKSESEKRVVAFFQSVHVA